ncbi:Swa2p [Saccharomyces cerevisiae Lalvin QA23]|nr:Swa2p [Saccharomyces cerevisiae Lalvin QA23]
MYFLTGGGLIKSWHLLFPCMILSSKKFLLISSWYVSSAFLKLSKCSKDSARLIIIFGQMSLNDLSGSLFEILFFHLALLDGNNSKAMLEFSMDLEYSPIFSCEAIMFDNAMILNG